MRADSPVGLVMYNWLPYSFKASRNTAGILRRPFSSTLAGQLPRSVMCPVLDRPLDKGMARQQEEVVANDRLHHTPLRLPTLLYALLLLPTLPHFCPHNRLLFTLVKGKNDTGWKKVECRRVWKSTVNHR